MSGITVAERDGQVAAVKIASSPERVARLDHEASVLSNLDHPGVVQYVSSTPGFPGELATRFVGPDNWGDQPPADAEAVLDAVSKLVATIADLHTAGVAHGALCLEHVLTSRDSFPILCGFADSQPAEPAANHSDAVDLGRLMHLVSEPLGGTIKTEFLAIADELAAGTVNALRATQQLDAIARPSGKDSPRTGASRRVLIATAASIVVVGASLVVIASPSADPVALAPAEAPVQALSPPTTLAPVAAPLPATPLSARAPVDPSATSTISTSPIAAPTPGAPELDHNGRRYALGQNGDLAVSGDWNCDGEQTPAVLRPSTGEVAVFGEWPSPTQRVSANTITTIDTAYRFEINPAEACPDLRVLTDTGSRLVTTETS